MRKHGIVRHLFAAAALCALALGAAPLWADEPPPEDFPPPAKTDDEAAPPPPKEPAPPPAVEPKPPAKKPAPKPPAKKPDTTPWSPPAVTPGGTGSALPPPKIIKRRSGTKPVLPPLQPPVQPPAGAIEMPPVVVDVPTTRATPPELPKLPPGQAPQPPADVRPPAPKAPEAPRPIPTLTGTSRVFGVAKTHNVPLPNKDLALQMAIDYEVRGQDGRDVYVAIWFVRTDTKKHIVAALDTYRDPSGFLTLQTRTARVRGAMARFTATMRIPYRAFPVAQPNDSYEVEARVQILRADRGGRATSLARGSTTFRVYGFAEETAPKETAAR